MTFVLIVLAIIIAIPVVMGISKGKARMHHANYNGALKNIQNDDAYEAPSWISQTEKCEMFRSSLTIQGEKRGIPALYTQLIFEEPSKLIFNLAGSMEKRGSSFLEQQAGSIDFLERMLNRLSAEHQAECRALDKQNRE